MAGANSANGGAMFRALQPSVTHSNAERAIQRVIPGKVALGRIVVVCARTSRAMPKLKTRKAAAKRFKATGTGKFMRRRAFRNHLLDHKTVKQKRHLATKAVVHESDELRVVRMLPYA